MSRKVDIIRSETWISGNIRNIDIILKETIEEYVDDNERIINIEVKKDNVGVSRFWIYIERNTKVVQIQ